MSSYQLTNIPYINWFFFAATADCFSAVKFSEYGMDCSSFGDGYGDGHYGFNLGSIIQNLGQGCGDPYEPAR